MVSVLPTGSLVSMNFDSMKERTSNCAHASAIAVSWMAGTSRKTLTCAEWASEPSTTASAVISNRCGRANRVSFRAPCHHGRQPAGIANISSRRSRLFSTGVINGPGGGNALLCAEGVSSPTVTIVSMAQTNVARRNERSKERSIGGTAGIAGAHGERAGSPISLTSTGFV